jgi:hypothetical protein
MRRLIPARLLCAALFLLGLCGAVSAAPWSDPCFNPSSGGSSKQSAVISVSSAATTNLVAVSGTTSVYVCGFALSIAGSATTAATASFEYGTSTSCTGTHALTGTFGSNDAAVSTTPTVVAYGDGNATVMSAPSANGICIVTTGNAVFVQGVLTYVQQ